MYQNIIIGGGAAGLFIAANLKGDNNLLLEGTKKLGQKILITGGGMCNITNMDETQVFITKFGDKKKENFLKPALMNLSTKKTREWLQSKGLNLIVRDDGKVFPESLKAQSLIDTLQREASKNGLLFKYSSKVLEVIKLKSHFEVKTRTETYKCKNLILTTGGKSFPGTGSDGSAYSIIKKLGHRLIETTPSLTSVKILDYPFKSLSGSSIKDSYIELFRDGENKRYLNRLGDILFTHQGLSGPGVLNNSRYIKNGDTILISLINCSNKEKKREELLKQFSSSGKKSIKNLLKEIGLTSSMTLELLKFLNIDDGETAKQINKKARNRIINSILGFPFVISNKTGFGAAMATAGGVDIGEINRKTMESKLVPGLYFAGEVLDIDGDTGGYNIQAAFSMGKIVADNINRINPNS